MNNTVIHAQVRELEKLIGRIKGVSDVVVILLDQPSGGQTLKAFVEPEDNRSLNAQSIINYCLKKSSSLRAPDSVYFCKIPRTPSGKVARNVLLEMCAG
jgi:fatty-acyl-CoA synthase